MESGTVRGGLTILAYRLNSIPLPTHDLDILSYWNDGNFVLRTAGVSLFDLFVLYIAFYQKITVHTVLMYPCAYLTLINIILFTGI